MRTRPLLLRVAVAVSATVALSACAGTTPAGPAPDPSVKADVTPIPDAEHAAEHASEDHAEDEHSDGDSGDEHAHGDSGDEHAHGDSGDEHAHGDSGDGHAHGDTAGQPVAPQEQGKWPMTLYFVTGPDTDPQLVPEQVEITVEDGQTKLTTALLAAVDGSAASSGNRSPWAALGVSVTTLQVGHPIPGTSHPAEIEAVIDPVPDPADPMAQAAVQQLLRTARAATDGPVTVTVFDGDTAIRGLSARTR